MRKIPINGIRLSREMAWAGSRYPRERDPGTVPVHRFLAEQRINMTCCGIQHSADTVQVSACIDLEHEQMLQGPGVETARVCALSVYPHRSDIRVPVMVAGLLHQEGIPVYHLVSSHAVVSVLVASEDEAAVIALLEAAFELPDSHTPFRQEVDTDMTQFLRKYPETRASYVEERIKT
ncbi:MAG: ACT domain-containing protein [Chlorobiales bacterium]|nr:ACT domain-containing protein [Chlorobiales bacterium]